MSQSPQMPGTQSKLLVWGVVAAVIVVVLIALAAWAMHAGEADARQATIRVYQATARAQRLYDRAVQLLSDTVVKDTQTDEVNPFVKPLNPNSLAETTWNDTPLDDSSIGTLIAEGRLVLLPPDSVNQKALTALDTGIESLTTALDDNPQAEPGAVALARRLLARSQSLRGRYHALVALVDRRTAASALDQAQILVNVLRGQATFLAEYDALLQLTDEDVQQRLTDSQAAATEAETAGKRFSEEILAAQRRVQTLRGEIDSLAANARVARAESDTSHGPAIAAGIARAQEADQQMYEKLKEVTAIQNRVRKALGEAQLAQAALETSRAGADAARTVLDQRSTQKEARTAERQKTVELIGDSQKDLVEQIKKVAQAIEAAREHETKALEAYSSAAEQLERSRIGLATQSAEAAADKGDVQMRIGELLSDRLALTDRITQLQQWVAELWPKLSPPRDPKEDLGLGAYAATAEADHALGVRSFNKAVSQYSAAIGALKSDDEKIYSWVYQGQLAAAHLGAYSLDPKPETLTVANEVINSALKDREASPFLAPVLRERDLLMQVQGGVSATQPATSQPSLEGGIEPAF